MPTSKAMRLLTIVPLMFFSLFASAKTYYVSNSSGSDGNSGISSSSPFQSLSKINSIRLSAGDSVLFKSGDTFYGQLYVTNYGYSSNPIVFSSYGSGDKPIITGFTNVTNWTNLGGNIWESTNAVSGLSNANMVTVNDVSVQMGRYPNNSFLTYNSHVGKSSITDNTLTGNWAGAELAMYITTYEIERSPITAQSGGTLYYNTASSIPIQRDGLRYLIQNDPRTLDTVNEWYFNPSTKKLRIYSYSQPTNVKISTVDILMSLDGLDGVAFGYVNLYNLSFKGSNQHSVQMRNAKNITIQNCDFDFSGGNAIYGPFHLNSTGLIVSNCTFNHSNNNAMMILGDFDHAGIRNNIIKNTGVFPGMCGEGALSSISIFAQGAGSVVEFNNIDSSGYIAIQFDRNDAVVQNNFVNHSLLYKIDGGAIYTWNGTGYGRPVFTGRKVLNNIVLNTSGTGIYMDDGTQGVEVAGNTVANGDYGLYIHGNNNMNVHDNTLYNNNLSQLLLVAELNDEAIRNVTLNKNIFFSKTASQLNLYFSTPWNDIASFGTADNNYYVRPVDDNVVFSLYPTINGSFLNSSYNLSGWQNYSNQDWNSKTSPKTIPKYTLNNLIGNNIYPYGDFEQNSYLPNVMAQGFNGTASVSLDNSGKISGKNSAMVSYSGDASGTTAEFKIFSLGTFTAGKKYILRFSSLGASSGTRIIGASLRKNGDDYAELEPMQYLSVPGSKTDNEILFSPSVSYKDVFLTLKVLGKDGTVWFDNIQIYEANATSVNPDDYIRFEYNATTSNKTVALDANYLDSKGQNYNGTITLAPFTSAVLIKNGQATNQPIKSNAGPDQIITLPLNTVTLTGNGSGSITAYQWRQLTGPSTVDPSNFNNSTTIANGLVQGIYTFELKVADASGSVDRDTAQITVNPQQTFGRVPLLANAGPDQTITLPNNSANLTGNGSGSISAYQWRQLSGPSSVMSGIDAVNATVSNLIVGNYQFELKVTDNTGSVARDTVQVTVIDFQKSIPLAANAGVDQNITIPTNSANLTGNGSGSITAYQWRQLSGPSSVMTGINAVNTTVTNLIVGIYQFELKVSDNTGSAARDTVQVTVNAFQQSIPLTANAGVDQTITLPTNSVNLTGTGTGPITAYQWRQLSGPSLSMYSSGNPNETVTNLIAGIYQFELKVSDNTGSVIRDTVQITVNAFQQNNLMTANAGDDQTITLPTNSINLYGSGTGPIAAYQWRQLSGPSVVMYSFGFATGTVNNLIAGIYKFELKVTDNTGSVIRDTMQVTVNIQNIFLPLAANAGPDQWITLPTNSVYLSGSGNGPVVFYQWRQLSGPSRALYSIDSRSASVNDLIQGVYQFELKVLDIPGSCVRDTMFVYVNQIYASEARTGFTLADMQTTTVAPSLITPNAAVTNEVNRNPLPTTNSLKVYPNPVSDNTTLEINILQQNTNVSIIVADMKGSVVLKKVTKSGYGVLKENLKMGNLPGGLYTITVLINDMVKETISIMKQ